MSVMTDLASGATEERLNQIEREKHTALFGNTMNFPYLELREIWGFPDLGSDFRRPVNSDVPTLFVSGTLDCQTPPEQAESARENFSQSSHIIVENAGHESLLNHLEVHEKIIEFINGEPMSDQTLQFHLRFREIELAE